MASPFSRTVVRQLARKGISLSGGQACPAYPGDEFFTAIAYGLVKNETHCLRAYSEVVRIAKGQMALTLD